MKKEAKKGASLWQDIVRPTLALCLILAVTVGILAVARHFTKEEKPQGAFRYDESVYLSVYPDAKLQAAEFETDDERIVEFLEAGEGRCLIAVAVKGYSNMELVFGISQKDMTDGVAFPVFEETQGLGSNIKKDKFLNQYIGQQGPFSMGENADGVAGATFSSKAFFEAMNAACRAFSDWKGGR